MQRSYKIKVSFFNGSVYKFQRTVKKIIKQVNVNNLVFNRFPKEQIRQIEVYCFNENTGKYYINLTYNYNLENWKNNHWRVERNTDGIKERFYLGRSTGWIPIYLEIKTNRSTGGSALHNKSLHLV